MRAAIEANEPPQIQAIQTYEGQRARAHDSGIFIPIDSTNEKSRSRRRGQFLLSGFSYCSYRTLKELKKSVPRGSLPTALIAQSKKSSRSSPICFDRT